MNKDLKLKNWAKRIGQELRSQRKAQGLSLDDVSRLSGSTVPTLSHIERGTRDVKLSTLISLTEALRIDLQSLFRTPDGGSYHDLSGADDGYDLDDT